MNVGRKELLGTGGIKLNYRREAAASPSLGLVRGLHDPYALIHCVNVVDAIFLRKSGRSAIAR